MARPGRRDADAPHPIVEAIAAQRRPQRRRFRIIFVVTWLVLIGGGLGALLVGRQDRLPRSWASGLPYILGGVTTTIYVAVISITFAIMFAVIGALGRLSSNPILYAISTLYVSLVRGTPLLVQILFIYLALPQVFPVVSDVPKEVLGIFALSFNYGAYMTETFRAGIQAVPRGQTEAAQALGMAGRDPDAPDHPPAGRPDHHPGHRQRLHLDDQGLVAGVRHRRPGAAVARPARRASPTSRASRR